MSGGVLYLPLMHDHDLISVHHGVQSVVEGGGGQEGKGVKSASRGRVSRSVRVCQRRVMKMCEKVR